MCLLASTGHKGEKLKCTLNVLCVRGVYNSQQHNEKSWQTAIFVAIG